MSNNRVFVAMIATKKKASDNVLSISHTLAEKGANIETMAVVQLGDQEVINTLFSLPVENADLCVIAIQDELAQFEPRVYVANPVTRLLKQTNTHQVLECVLSLYATYDAPKIVRNLTKQLTDRNILIESMAAASYSAPFDGSPMFMAELHLQVPSKHILRWLAASVEMWESQFDWDLTLEIPCDGRYRTSIAPAMMPFPPTRLVEHITHEYELQQ